MIVEESTRLLTAGAAVVVVVELVVASIQIKIIIICWNVHDVCVVLVHVILYFLFNTDNVLQTKS
mgnify:CR=1 FL=1